MSKPKIPAPNDNPEHIDAILEKIKERYPQLSSYKKIADVVKCDPSNIMAYKRSRDNKSSRKCNYHLQVVLELLAEGIIVP